MLLVATIYTKNKTAQSIKIPIFWLNIPPNIEIISQNIYILLELTILYR